jgi:maleate isomerase
MKNTLGHRATIGILVPGRNTTVQPESDDMRPPGVTNHVARMGNIGMPEGGGADFKIGQYALDVEGAIDMVKLALPDIIMLGHSHDSFEGGVAGGTAFQKRLSDHAGMPVLVPSISYVAAVKAMSLKRVGILTPYLTADDALVRDFFEDAGCTVAKMKALQYDTGHAIAQTPDDVIRGALAELNVPEVDAILQVGTNLPTARISNEAEFWLKKPVLSVNVVDYWHVLRTVGINDRIDGFGTLLRDY